MDPGIVTFADEIPRALASYCLRHDIARATVVADANTYRILGRDVTSALSEHGITASAVILGNRLIADERAVMSVLCDVDTDADALVSVGSGTVTDITRFASHRMAKRFLVVPTAPSIDGYASKHARLVLKGFKEAVRCHVPERIFASIPLLSAAPRSMIAAGVADIVARTTALADWRLAQLMHGRESGPAAIADPNDTFHMLCDHSVQLARSDPNAVGMLFNALASTTDSTGIGSGDSPVSGCEHHISYFIEMYQLRHNRPPVLQGFRVALGTIIASQWYRNLRSWKQDDIRRLEVELPDYDEDIRQIMHALGEGGEILLDRNSFISTLSRTGIESMRSRLVARWNEVQEIAGLVPEPSVLMKLFRAIGAPTRPDDIGLTRIELDQAARLSHYMGGQVTVKTLHFVLGIPAPLPAL